MTMIMIYVTPMCFLLLNILTTASAVNTTNATTAPQPESDPVAVPVPLPPATTEATSSSTSHHKITDENIHHAVKSWLKDQDATLATFGSIDTWDTSHVTDMSHLFSWEREHSLMNLNANITHWNVHRVHTMSHLFYGNVAMNLNFQHWNVSQVHDMSGAFANTKQFEGHGLGHWDTRNLKNASRMFSQATAFSAVGVRNWHTPKLQDASRMFHATEQFHGNYTGGGTTSAWRWNVTHNLKDISEMFSHAINFVGDLSTLDVSKVTDMKGAFFKATKFNGNLKHWDTKNVEDMNSAFTYAESFSGIGVADWNVQKVTSMANLFKRTAVHQNLNKWKVDSCTDLRNAFRYAINMTHKVCWELNPDVDVEGIFFQSNAHFDTSCVKDHKFIVDSCCRPHLDKDCECGVTTVNQDHEMEHIGMNDKNNHKNNTSSSSSSSSSSNNAQQQEQSAAGAVTLSSPLAGKHQYFLAVGVGALCLSVMMMAVVVRRFRQHPGRLLTMTTTTIHCGGDEDDPDISDLDMNPYPSPGHHSSRSSSVGMMGDGIFIAGSKNDAIFLEDHLGPLEDIPVRDAKII